MVTRNRSHDWLEKRKRQIKRERARLQTAVINAARDLNDHMAEYGQQAKGAEMLRGVVEALGYNVDELSTDADRNKAC